MNKEGSNKGDSEPRSCDRKLNFSSRLSTVNVPKKSIFLSTELIELCVCVYVHRKRKFLISADKRNPQFRRLLRLFLIELSSSFISFISLSHCSRKQFSIRFVQDEIMKELTEIIYHCVFDINNIMNLCSH